MIFLVINRTNAIFSPELELGKTYKMMIKYMGKYAVLDMFWISYYP